MVRKDANNAEPLEQHETVNQVSDIIGTWGRWQTNIALCVISVAAFSAYNGLSGAFYGPTINFKCADDLSTQTTTNITVNKVGVMPRAKKNTYTCFPRLLRMFSPQPCVSIFRVRHSSSTILAQATEHVISGFTTRANLNQQSSMR